jgi:hypothetical protein
VFQCTQAKAEEQAGQQALRQDQAKAEDQAKQEAKRRQEQAKKWKVIQNVIQQDLSSELSLNQLDIPQMQSVFQQAREIQEKTHEEIKDLILHGLTPVGIWKSALDYVTSTQQRIQTLDQELDALTRETADLTQRMKTARSKIEQITTEKTKLNSAVFPKGVEILSQVEEQLVQSFQTRIQHEDWSVFDMTDLDVALVLNTHGLISLLPSIRKANVSGELLAVAVGDKRFGELGIEGEYLEFQELEFAWDLLQAHQFPPGDHLKNCPVCRGKRGDVLREWKLEAIDLSAFPNINIPQLLYVSKMEMVNLFKLPARDVLKFKAMKAAHDAYLLAPQ